MSKLYLVGTPIGNLEDMSPRAVRTLMEADFIAAEDTRVSLRLLTHFGIRKPMVSYHEHNRSQSGPRIVARISAGESCALVTDAGMPCISDPGAELVALCEESGVPVVPIPGPSACIAALAASGLAGGRFCFEGFLSVNKTARKKHLDEIKLEPRVMVFYEAPHKLMRTLSDMRAALGDRQITLARELTKLHEQVLRMSLSEAVAYYEQQEPRGEFVLVVEGAAPLAEEKPDIGAAAAMARALMADGMAASAAAKEAAKHSGHQKSEIYRLLMAEEAGENA